ncbi:hypothetical protein IMG5_136220, partial [Ichthyophthirius multifiliis]
MEDNTVDESVLDQIDITKIQNIDSLVKDNDKKYALLTKMKSEKKIKNNNEQEKQNPLDGVNLSQNVLQSVNEENFQNVYEILQKEKDFEESENIQFVNKKLKKIQILDEKTLEKIDITQIKSLDDLVSKNDEDIANFVKKISSLKKKDEENEPKSKTQKEELLTNDAYIGVPFEPKVPDTINTQSTTPYTFPTNNYQEDLPFVPGIITKQEVNASKTMPPMPPMPKDNIIKDFDIQKNADYAVESEIESDVETDQIIDNNQTVKAPKEPSIKVEIIDDDPKNMEQNIPKFPDEFGYLPIEDDQLSVLNPRDGIIDENGEIYFPPQQNAEKPKEEEIIVVNNDNTEGPKIEGQYDKQPIQNEILEKKDNDKITSQIIDDSVKPFQGKNNEQEKIDQLIDEKDQLDENEINKQQSQELPKLESDDQIEISLNSNDLAAHAENAEDRTKQVDFNTPSNQVPEPSEKNKTRTPTPYPRTLITLSLDEDEVPKPLTSKQPVSSQQITSEEIMKTLTPTSQPTPVTSVLPTLEAFRPLTNRQPISTPIVQS